MTCGIVAKKENEMIFGIDSCITFSNMVKKNYNDDIKVDKVKDVYIVSSGNAKDGQKIISMVEKSNDNRLVRALHDTDEDFINDYLECFLELAEENFRDSKFEGEAIIFYKTFAFYLDSSFAYYQVQDYQTIGCGAEVAAGAYLALDKSKMSLEKKVLKCLRISENLNEGVRAPFVIVDAIEEKEIIYKK